MHSEIITHFERLKSYCEHQDFKGWDPYDGLNSRLFQATPFKHWSFGRLAWIQLFKRNPVNLRRLLLVPKGYNPKGLGLFLTGYCNLYRIAEKGDDRFGEKDEIKEKIIWLSDKLLSLQSEGYSGACWGYNFDWQARGGLFFPAKTPNVVTTTYVVNGLLDAAQILQDEYIRKTASTASEFVLRDLTRTPKKEGFLFSYAPKFGNNTVYNASLLGSKLLARIYSLTGKEQYAEAARASVLACCNEQNEDGSWYYGELSIQNWIDSFHTGFNLEAIFDYAQYTGDSSFKTHYNKGMDYYLENFFLEDGTPKYYHDKTYPIDIHSPAQFVITLIKTGVLKQHLDKAQNVISWTLNNMQHHDGAFYYQIKKSHANKVPYMRWSQAWMFASLSGYLKESLNN